MDLSNRAKAYQSMDVSKKSYAILQNVYDPIHNPEGVVNLARADNSLCEDIILEKLGEQHSFKFESWMQYYFDLFGVKSFRSALAKFIQKRFKAVGTIDPNNVAVTLGCQAAIDLLFYIITDPGDCVLITAPFYGTLVEDLFRVGVRLFHVFPSTEDFCITSKEFEEAFNQAESQGMKVKAVFIINPDNPTGRARTREELEDILEFSHRHNLHTVINEIYALSPLTPESPFCSVLSLPELLLPLKTHITWSFSKDMGLSGLRCGVIHTKLDFSSFGTLFYMETPSSVVQATLTKLIQDEKWLDEVYFPTNQTRMRDAYKKVHDALKSFGAEPFPKCHAGFFVWTNFSKILKTCTKEEEWKLYETFLANGVYVKPGQIYKCPFPGWFRIIYTYQECEITLGLERMKKAIKVYRNQCDSA